MPLSNQTRQAINRYGPRVDKLARSRYGISGRALLAKLIQGESGGRRGATSSAGAHGLTQFMPGTRQAALKRGVDPWGSDDDAVHAAVLHLKGKLTGSKGLEGYNPGGGSKYVNYILGQDVGKFTDSHVQALAKGHNPDSFGVSVSRSSKTRDVFDKDSYDEALRGQTLAKLFSRHEGGSVLTRTGLLSSAPLDKADFRRSEVSTSRRVGLTRARGSKGVSVAGKGLPGGLSELIWRGPGAQTVKDGKRVPRDFYTAHEDHVHVAGNVRALKQLEALVKAWGGRVTTPISAGGTGHVTGSYHYGRGKGKKRVDAIDVVFDDPKQMAKFAKRVAKGYGL